MRIIRLRSAEAVGPHRRTALFATVFAFVLCTTALFASFSVHAQQRANYGMLLEPTDGVLHGAGQDPVGFAGYWDSMQAGEKPISYMYYIGLNTIPTTWAANLKRDLRPYLDQMIVLQIGLELTEGGTSYTDGVNLGIYDAQIETFIDGLHEIGLPAYVRIGFEFNGVSWNGYQPASYKPAFRRIAGKIKERDLEIATVWNYAADGVDNFMDFHPGDDVIDWWSLNVFSSSHFTKPVVQAYIDSAGVHQRPLLIGESTPRYIGTPAGPTAWESWFVPFFNMIRGNPGIKQFSYINWDWSQYPRWSDWGDARLESNAVVRANYQAEMDSSIYVHASSESAFRSLLGYDDSVSPPQLGAIAVADSSYPATMTWTEPVDDSGIARYLIYDDGVLIDYTGKTTYSFAEAGTGAVKQVTVVAVDRAGNLSPPSDPVEVSIPGDVKDANEKITNGDFQLGLAFWELAAIDAGASGTVAIDDSGLLNGPNAAKITVTNSTGTGFHLQLRQPLSLVAGKGYVIKYQARANQPTQIETLLQQDHDPYGNYSSAVVNLTTDSQSFVDTARVNQDDTVFLTFFVGNSGLSEIWLDSISVIEADLAPRPEAMLVNGDFEQGVSGWELVKFVGDAQATFEIDSTGSMEGMNAAHVVVTQTTGTNWHMQLRQFIDVREGKMYIIEYQARADQNTTIETFIQQDHDPFFGYAEQLVNLTTETQTFVDTAFVDIDDTAYLTFMVGNSGTSQIWIDAVSVTIKDNDTAVDESSFAPDLLTLHAPYPNPFVRTTRLSYTVAKSGNVKMRVFDVTGRVVATLMETEQPAGSFDVEWVADGVASGLYIIRIESNGQTASAKVVLQR